MIGNILSETQGLERTEVFLIVILAVIVIAALIQIFILINLRNKMTVQRMKFLGFYSTDPVTRENYAEFNIGNKSLNDVGVAEIGIRNGNVTFDLTSLYKKKAGLDENVRIVVEQRSSISFRLTEEELATVLIDGQKGKVLSSLRVYCVDLTGTLYMGKIPKVKKLVQRIKTMINDGSFSPSAPSDSE